MSERSKIKLGGGWVLCPDPCPQYYLPLDPSTYVMNSPGEQTTNSNDLAEKEKSVKRSLFSHLYPKATR
jgi:hypothetical protein